MYTSEGKIGPRLERGGSLTAEPQESLEFLITHHNSMFVMQPVHKQILEPVQLFEVASHVAIDNTEIKEADVTSTIDKTNRNSGTKP